MFSNPFLKLMRFNMLNFQNSSNILHGSIGINWSQLKVLWKWLPGRKMAEPVIFKRVVRSIVDMLK